MRYATTWNDIRDCIELYKEWTGRQISEDRIQTNSHLVIVRDDNNKIIASAQILTIDDPIWDRRWALIENVYVAKGQRRRGVGTELMEAIESQAVLYGCEFIKLTSSKKAGQALYRSLGYEEGSSFKKWLK